MVTRTESADRAVEHEARESLMNLASGSIVVRDVEIERVEDMTGALVWQVLLVLDPPPTGSWDVAETQQLKRDARRITDEIASEHDVNSEGVTSILITARNAPEEDVAPPDEPDPDERTDVERGIEDPA